MLRLGEPVCRGGPQGGKGGGVRVSDGLGFRVEGLQAGLIF